MNRARPWLLALGLALPACQRPEEPLRPADLLPRPRLVAALVDLHLLESRVENASLKPDSARALFLAQQKNIFWTYHLNDSSFQHSVRYYGIHGKDLDEIYAAVVDSLDARAHRLNPALSRTPLPPGARPH